MDVFNKCAIVVDDDQPVLSLISDLAEMVGFSVKGFLRPVEALDYLKKHGADVVLTDYRMPEMNGLLLAKEIRKADPTIPILMITGEADHFLFKQMALDNGVTDFLRKPFDFAALEAKLHSLLVQEKVLT